MGAWEVQADPSKPDNHIMRQVSPVWPACWGYSCTGPMTYFGPKAFNASGPKGFTISLDVKLEKDAVFGIGGSTGGKGGFVGLRLDSTKQAGFTVGQFHKVTVTLKPGSMSATLDGKPVNGQPDEVREGGGIKDGFYIEMSLDRYVMADVDNFQLTV